MSIVAGNTDIANNAPNYKILDTGPANG
jgi:hypothetical protein